MVPTRLFRVNSTADVDFGDDDAVACAREPVGSLGETTKARGNAEPDLSSELLFFGLIWLEDDVFFSGNRRLQEVRFVCVSSRDGLLESHVINLQ